jgi:hypothetical protein
MTKQEADELIDSVNRVFLSAVSVKNGAALLGHELYAAAEWLNEFREKYFNNLDMTQNRDWIDADESLDSIYWFLMESGNGCSQEDLICEYAEFYTLHRRLLFRVSIISENPELKAALATSSYGGYLPFTAKA